MRTQTNHTVYAPVGRCIYCGSTKGPLGKEHIVPYGLGGTFILPRASCQRCSSITGQYEGWCLRVMFGVLRYQANIPTRRPNTRPTHVELTRKRKGGRVDVFNVPPKKLPPVIVGFLLPAPGIIRGGLPTESFKPGHWLLTTRQWGRFGRKRDCKIPIGKSNLTS
jgi:hypothetical protein